MASGTKLKPATEPLMLVNDTGDHQSSAARTGCQYRYKSLPTNKVLQIYRKPTDAPTDADCRIPQPSGARDTVSGFIQSSKVTFFRHNRAGTAIVEVIQAGLKVDQLVTADIGGVQESKPEHNRT